MLGTFVRMQEAADSGTFGTNQAQDMIISAVGGLMSAVIVSFMMTYFLKGVGSNLKPGEST